jgi:hypothetical protein
MDRHYIGRVTATALGFLMGALFAMIIAPGDTLLIVGTGIVFGFFARSLFDRGFLGYSLWVFSKSAGRKTLAAKPSTGHR